MARHNLMLWAERRLGPVHEAATTREPVGNLAGSAAHARVRVRVPDAPACTSLGRRQPTARLPCARRFVTAPAAGARGAMNAHPHDHDGEPGTVYVLHFDPPYRHAGHYIGWAQDADARISQHLAGTGSPLVRAAVLAGSHVELAATFAGSRSLERRLKRWHNTTTRVCPICRARRAAAALLGHRAAGDRLLGASVHERALGGEER
jgi:predicted GIY-YIG superfamily endonuclease